MENRLIAMLDVLGLSSQIEDKNELQKVIEKYNRLIKEAREKVFVNDTLAGSLETKNYNFEVGEFVFDTLVLVSYPIDVKSSCKFILSTLRLMELFSNENMPLRGAIGIGDYCADDETKIFLSNVFKQLSKEEQNQQWAGCVLLQEAEEQIISNVIGRVPMSSKQSDVMHRLSIPIKSDTREIRWCLNWTYQLQESKIKSLLEYMKGDMVKYEKTKSYINHIKSLPDEFQLLTPEFSPATKLKAMKTRACMNIRFEDENGLPAEPGCEQWNLQVMEAK
ncbi:hypothetical protein [Sulfurimonas sp. RIFOXYB12_FULL_35_9]|uniref:hypothetical protein n=1 Tax=Sulfurimonas sp. RIFOXYB12_FULL_35_9 TaxID=1802256 RepID=UPI001BB8F6B2|nr:hypothetical protein [Sulfurimonas sp. RIFOXYB12_FULL_35_9]MBS4068680.1 hypothetical protein [Sulfurimonas sp.]